MKVRCINNENRSNHLKLGEIYEAELIDHISGDKRWVVKGINSMSFYQHRFEVVNEDNIEKTFREVIADIKEGEIWESRSKYIRRFTDAIQIYHKENGRSTPSMLMCNNDKFKLKLQRKEYTFEEAFKAYEEGKVIESCYSQFKYKRANGVDLYSRTENDWYEEENFEIDEIRGKWYINN